MVYCSFLIAAMGLQVVWSFGLAIIDIHALRLKKDLHNHIFLSFLVVGDWVSNFTFQLPNNSYVLVFMQKFILIFGFDVHVIRHSFGYYDL